MKTLAFKSIPLGNWGLRGGNGRGKTTFLNLLQGKYEYSGHISADVGFEYFPFQIENPEYLTMDVVSEIFPDYVNWELMRELNLLKVSEDVLYRPFASLSNGEQTKVMLAALFLKENRFLLIDEPTNHLDMEGRKLVSDYLAGKSGFILVSHDRAFFGQLRGSYPVHQQNEYRNSEGQFFRLVGKQTAAG
ncbi:hypothetical protein HMSSN036_00490 [Paenibacillus macerans]|nr:hypothetical protein HMSSN036_00490 [Paenibacillus macerans]